MRREKLSINGLEVSPAAVEQADQGRIDMPDFIGTAGAQTDFGFGRMNALPGSPPLEVAYEAIPSRPGCENLAQALSQ